MDVLEHLEAIRRESARFARAARGPLDAPVPSCPEWTLGDLVWHLGGVQWFWSQIVRTRALDRSGIDAPDDRPDEELVAWFEEVSAGLVAALEDVDPGTRVWSWAGGQQDVAWAARRQAHEVAVHRWDAQRAVGRPEPIATPLAADGIDEFFEWMFDLEEGRGADASVAVRLAPTDADRAWVVSVRDGAIDMAAEPARAEATVRAPVSDLLLLLWRRAALDAMRVEGDRTALERFLAIADLS